MGEAWPVYRCWDPTVGSSRCRELEAVDEKTAAEEWCEDWDHGSGVPPVKVRTVFVREVATGRLFRVTVEVSFDADIGVIYSAETSEVIVQ